MPDREYYTSERFIWDDLCQQAESGIPSLYESWKKVRRIEPFLLAWPSEPVLDDQGILLDRTCLLDLKGDPGAWSQTFRAFAARTKAYALLLAEQHAGVVRTILESHHGTRSWSLPILTSGDIRYLGTPPLVADNLHQIGILWSRKSPVN